MRYDGAIALDLDWSELRKFDLDTAPRPATSASFLVGKDGSIRLAAVDGWFLTNNPDDSAERAWEKFGYGSGYATRRHRGA
jgi:hypothetical protein